MSKALTHALQRNLGKWSSLVTSKTCKKLHHVFCHALLKRKKISPLVFNYYWPWKLCINDFFSLVCQGHIICDTYKSYLRCKTEFQLFLQFAFVTLRSKNVTENILLIIFFRFATNPTKQQIYFIAAVWSNSILTSIELSWNCHSKSLLSLQEGVIIATNSVWTVAKKSHENHAVEMLLLSSFLANPEEISNLPRASNCP